MWFGATNRSQAPPYVVSFTTSFPANENPISESGAWTNHAADCSAVRTELISSTHVAHGTQSPGGTFNDSTATLSGFARSHRITGTLYKAAGITSSPNAEVELHLSWSDQNASYTPPGGSFGTTTVMGYEINVNQNDDYLILGRFKGVELTRGSANSFSPTDGDLFQADFVYNTSDGSADITVKWNGVTKISYHDTSPPPAGNPGVGFYIDSGVSNKKFGFKSVTAVPL